MSWFDTPQPSNIKAPNLRENEWETGAIDPALIAQAEDDYFFKGGADALKQLAAMGRSLHSSALEVKQGLRTGLETGGLYLSMEGAALRWAMLKSADTEGPLAVSPEQAKEEFGIDIDFPISQREAYVRQMLKEDYDEQLAEWAGEALQVERPHVTLATWAGTAAALWALPSTRLFKGAIKKAVVAGGAAVANAAMVQAAAKLGGRLEEVSRIQRAAAGLAKPISDFDKWARRLSPTQRAVGTTLAVEGSANALEALGAQAIEKRIGNDYDVTGELALAYAAPAVLGAAGRVLKGMRGLADEVGEYEQFGKAINEKLTKKAAGFEAEAELQWGREQKFPKRPKRVTVAFEGDEGPSNLPVAWESVPVGARPTLSGAQKTEGRIAEQLLSGPQDTPLQLRAKLHQQLLPAGKKTKDLPTLYKDEPQLLAELDKLDALARLEELYGPDAVQALNGLRTNMTKIGFNKDLDEIFPWLRSQKAVDTHVESVGANRPVDELFDMAADEADQVISKNQPPEESLNILKEVQQKAAVDDPIAKIKQASDEAAVLEEAKLTSASALQETADDITFKDPKTGKVLKFPKAKVQKVGAVGRGSLDRQVKGTAEGGGTVRPEDLADQLGRGKGNMVLVRHKDGGEAFKLPESFVNRLEAYEKEFPSFPKLEKVDKIGFQEGIAKANADMDTAFKSFRKCIGEGG